MNSNPITNKDFNGEIADLIDKVIESKGDVRTFIDLINGKIKTHNEVSDSKDTKNEPTEKVSDILGIGIDY